MVSKPLNRWKWRRLKKKVGVRVSFTALVTWVQNIPLDGNLKTIRSVKHHLCSIISSFSSFPGHMCFCFWRSQGLINTSGQAKQTQVVHMNTCIHVRGFNKLIKEVFFSGCFCLRARNEKPTLDKGYFLQPSVHIFSIYIHLPDDQPHSWSWRRNVAPFAFSLLSSFLCSCWSIEPSILHPFYPKKNKKQKNS